MPGRVAPPAAPGPPGPPRGVVRALTAGLVVVVAAATAGVVVLRVDPAAAGTVLAEARDVSLVDADGSVLAGTAGADVPDRTAVRVGPAGLAVLTTRSSGRTRQVVLGPRSLYRVVDGVTGVLLRGDAVVDRSAGPRLALRAGATRVAVREGTVVRVDRRYALRVAAFRGSVALRGAGGRRTGLVALEQLVQTGRALPTSPAPLRLRGDLLDRRADPALVRDDAVLTGLAARLDATGQAVRLVRLTPAAVLSAGPPADAADPGSETALPRALARVGEGDGDEVERYARARGVRAAGGAWAVVARTVEADVAAVPGAVAGLLSPSVLAGGPAGVPADPGQEQAGGADGAPLDGGDDGTSSDGDPSAAGGSVGSGSGAGGASAPDSPGADEDGADGDGGDGDGDGGGGPTARPGPRPSPSPSPTPGPTGSPDPTQDPVGFVLGQLPTEPPGAPVGLPPTPTPPAPGQERAGAGGAGSVAPAGSPVVRQPTPARRDASA